MQIPNLIIEVKPLYVPSKNQNFQVEGKSSQMEEKCQDISNHQKISMREIDRLGRAQATIQVIQIIL